MVNQSYCSPKLVINGTSYNTLSDFQLKFPGNNQINSLNFGLSSLDIKEQALYGKPVELFLNYGSEDGVPIFRGVIRDISPTTKGVKFSALDSRSLMAGTSAAPLNITDNNNYDGYTLGQFLQKIIQEDYMSYEYVDDLAAGIQTTETIATGDGVQAAASPLLTSGEEGDNSEVAGAILPIQGQAVTLSDGYNTETFEFCPTFETVQSGHIPVLISTSGSGNTPTKVTMDNLITAIEANLHIDMNWSSGDGPNETPYIIRLNGEQKIAGTIGHTIVSQSFYPPAVWPYFVDNTAPKGNNTTTNFSGGSGSVTHTGTLSSIPIKRGTIDIKVDNRNAGTPVYVQKGKDTKFGTFSDSGAVTTSPHETTDVSPRTTISSGTIDYVLGEWSITFTDPPWSGKAIQAVYNKPSKENVVSLLGTNLLNDTDPPVSLTGYRNDNVSPYDIILEKISEAIDTTDLEKPREWFVQIKEDDEKSNIVFVKRQSKDSADTIVLSYRDGISQLKYKQRLPANTGTTVGTVGGRQVFVYGNRPRGIVSKEIKKSGNKRKQIESRIEGAIGGESADQTYPAEAHKQAIVEIFKELDEVNEVTLTANKAPYIGLESIVDLNIEDDAITGRAVVVGKDISWSRTAMNIQLKLDRRPTKLSDYIKNN